MKKVLLLTAVYLTALCSGQTKEFWGSTNVGGSFDGGVIYKTDLNGNNLSVQKQFKLDFDGQTPMQSAPIQATNGKFYGMTQMGGFYNKGVLFEYDPLTKIYTKKIDFNGVEKGANPRGGVIQASNGKLYGMTELGGANEVGVIFEYDLTTNVYTKKFDFDNVNGAKPYGDLFQASNGKLYGLTYNGGISSNGGVAFEYNTETNAYAKIFDFTGVGKPHGGMIQASNGMLYAAAGSNLIRIYQYDLNTGIFNQITTIGTISSGGSVGSLTEASNGKLYGMSGISMRLFEYDISSNRLTIKYQLPGSMSNGKLLSASDGKLYGMSQYSVENGLGELFSYDPTTNIYSKKIDFNGSNGSKPFGSLMQANNGKLYGMTSKGGGGKSAGVFFEYDIVNDSLVPEFTFYAGDATEGSSMDGNDLLQASNGKLYGITSVGGAYNNGVLFEIDPVSNTYTKKIDMQDSGGRNLMQASNGKLYGFTTYGGSSGFGTIFEYDTATNIYSKIYEFVNDANDSGYYPWGSVLSQASNGKLYGTTYIGTDYGKIFEFDPITKIYTKKYDLDNTNGKDGNAPFSMTLALNGKFYGMTNSGGLNGQGVIFEFDPLTGVYNKKFDFDYYQTGSYPQSTMRLVNAPNGKLYGMTQGGGPNGAGALFEYDYISNVFTKKYDFLRATGGFPSGSLMAASNGKLYGMTQGGGENDHGVVFEYDLETNVYTKKADFNCGTNGCRPKGGLIEITLPNMAVDNNQMRKFIIYPNPAKDILNFSEEVSDIRISDVAGRMVKQFPAKTKSVNVANLAKGVYIISATNKDGKTVNQKIIKE